MADEPNGNGVRYTLKEALAELRTELLGAINDVRDDVGDVKNDVKNLAQDVADLKGFKSSLWLAAKIMAFTLTTAIAISGVLLMAGAFK
jgi:hypothetical protein